MVESWGKQMNAVPFFSCAVRKQKSCCLQLVQGHMMGHIKLFLRMSILFLHLQPNIARYRLGQPAVWPITSIWQPSYNIRKTLQKTKKENVECQVFPSSMYFKIQLYMRTMKYSTNESYLFLRKILDHN